MEKERKSKDPNRKEKASEAMLNERMKDLFGDRDELPAHISLQQADELQARVKMLEAKLAEQGAATSQGNPAPAQEKVLPSLPIQPVEVSRVIAESPAVVEKRQMGEKESLPPETTTPKVRNASRLKLSSMRLQTRLILLIVMAAVPVFALGALLVNLRGRAIIEQQAIEQLRLANSSIAKNTSAEIIFGNQILNQLALMPDITNMDPNQQIPVLKAVGTSNPEYYLVHVMDLTGMDISRSDGGKNTDYKDRLYFQKPASGGPVTFQTVMGKTSGRPALTVGTAIRDSAGNIVGVVGYASNLSDLSSYVQASKVGNTGYAYVVDDKNFVVAHPDTTYTAKLTDFSKYPPVAMLRQGKIGPVTFIDDQGRAWHAYTTVLDNGWGIIVQQLDSEYLQTSTTFGFISLLVFAGGLLILLVIIWLLIRQATRPVAALTQTAAAIADGDLTQVISVTGQDEIGVLGNTFNRMTSQLRTLIGTLEQRVADRTYDLELAAEVGRTVNEKVANLQDMLSEAVETIRSRYKLYYTQVYLVDPSSRTISLRSGTGEVGRQLLQRGHRLAIGSGSLNGRAVADKKPILVADTTQSANFLPNPLLPNTRSEMVIPLIAAGQVIGTLDMQSETPGALNEYNQTAFEALAGQISVAIQNANLFAQTQEVQQEMEANARQVSVSGWNEFLNGVDRSERIGYLYDQNETIAINELASTNSGSCVSLPITVTGATVGQIQAAYDSLAITMQDQQIMEATAARLGQHIESLRLLAQSEHYQAEAEQAVRQLTRQGWESYSNARKNLAPGFVYDLNEVKLLDGRRDGEPNNALKQSLVVRDEPIGELEVELETSSEDASTLISSVAVQLSGHIENLRLFEETQEALTWQEALNRTSAMIGQAKTVDEVVRGAAELLPFLGMLSCSASIITEVDSAGTPMVGDIHIVRYFDNEFKTMPTILGQAMSDWLPSDPQYYQENRVSVFPDLTDLTKTVPNNALKPAGSIGYLLKVGMHSAITVGLGLRDRAIGYLTFASQTSLSRQPMDYIERMENIVDLVSAALDNQQLLQETERGRQALGRRAEELETVAAVSVTTATMLDPDRLLQTIVDLTKERFGVYHAHIYLTNDAWQTLILAAGAGEVGRKMVAEEHAIAMDTEQSLVARSARERLAVIVNDVRADPSFLPNPLLPETRAEMAVPMIVGDKVLGVFDVQSDQMNRFGDEDASIYTTLAAQVGVALQNARLYVAQTATVAQLRELDRLKSSFLANMSHELRTPLNSILGFSDVILEEIDGPLTENMNNDVQLIQKNGQHLLHLINDVLDMAKIEAGKMNLAVEKVNLHYIIEEVTNITSPLASEKSLDLCIEADSDHELELTADRTRLRQVLINLVNNAIKFTDKGRIALRAVRQDDHVLVSIQDTGIGIRPEQLEVVFQEFTQVDTSTTRKAGGTGLGLPISRKLVEMHGGRLWAESSGVAGEGSTFYIQLPVEANVKEADQETVK